MALTTVLPFQSGYFSISAAQPAGVAACASMGARSPAAMTAPSAASHARLAPVNSFVCILPAPSNGEGSRWPGGVLVPSPRSKLEGKLRWEPARMTCLWAHKILDQAGARIEHRLPKAAPLRLKAACAGGLPRYSLKMRKSEFIAR